MNIAEGGSTSLMLAVLSGDMFEGQGSCTGSSAKQTGSKMTTLSMKMSTKFTEASARSWPKPN